MSNTTSKVPTIRTPKNPGEMQRYHGTVREYCAREFPEGASASEITKRLWSKGGHFSVWVIVEREYLKFLGVSGRKMKRARLMSYGVGVAAVVAAYVVLDSIANPSWFAVGVDRKSHVIEFILFACVFGPLVAFLAERVVRTYWKLMGSHQTMRRVH